MIDFTMVMEAIISLATVIVSTVLVPYMGTKISTKKQEEINYWIKIAVTAAEQIYVGSGRGSEKKAYVIQWLRDHGIYIDEGKMDAIIESMVYELKNGVFVIHNANKGELANVNG